MGNRPSSSSPSTGRESSTPQSKKKMALQVHSPASSANLTYFGMVGKKSPSQDIFVDPRSPIPIGEVREKLRNDIEFWNSVYYICCFRLSPCDKIYGGYENTIVECTIVSPNLWNFMMKMSVSPSVNAAPAFEKRTLSDVIILYAFFIPILKLCKISPPKKIIYIYNTKNNQWHMINPIKSRRTKL